MTLRDLDKVNMWRQQPILYQLVIFLQRFMRRIEVGRSVIYGILTSIWSAIAAPVTFLFIVKYFTLELQGFYYTFYSLFALQTFIELGFGIVIIQFAAHEWSKLSLNRNSEIEGDSVALSRLVSLARITLRWFATGGILMAIGLSVGGYILFSVSNYPDINWTGPWFLFCILAGINICLLPILSLLQGCNQVARVYALWMFQAILRNIVAWVAMALGAKLWTPVISMTVVLIWSVVYLRRHCSPFLRLFFFFTKKGPKMSWSSEIWPMQWRIALSSIGGYFMTWFFTPVLFRYHGAAIAGKAGMTFGLIFSVATISSIWIQTRIPEFAILIAKKQYKALDRIFFKITSISIFVLLFGALVIWTGVYLLNIVKHPIAERFLPPLPMGLFLLANIFLQITHPFSVYLRAHKKEPYLILSVVTGMLVGLSTWILGSRFSAIGMAIGYLAITGLFSLPYALIVWYRCRAVWHAQHIEVKIA